MTLEFLIATLDCLPEEISEKKDIQSFIDKLKSDYNQFLHPTYLDDLTNWSLLSEESNLTVMNIWLKLNNTPQENWSTSSFENDATWIGIRSKATSVKKSFLIDVAMNAIYDWDAEVNDLETYFESVSDFLDSGLDLTKEEIEGKLEKCNPENDGWKMQSIMTLSEILVDNMQKLDVVLLGMKTEIDQILEKNN
jgi:hypothetical protein